MTVYTANLTSGSITINKNEGVVEISVRADSTSGSFSVLGTGTLNGINSEAVVMEAGEGWGASASSPQSPIEGVTITWISGSVRISVSSY